MAPCVPLSFGIEIEFVFAMRKPRESHSWFEYLEYIQEQLRLQQVSCQVDTEHSRSDYSRWKITNDGSINGEQYEDLLPRPQGLGGDEWEFNSGELISPPYLANDSAAFAEIAKCMNAIQGSKQSRHAAFTDSNCGFHVHVGVDPSSSHPVIPLEVLQHLAMLLVRYEGIISGLQPMERRDLPITRGHRYCSSNLTAFKKTSHTCQPNYLIPFDFIASTIFAPGMQLEVLADIMGAHKPLNDHHWSIISSNQRSFLERQVKKKWWSQTFRSERGSQDTIQVNSAEYTNLPFRGSKYKIVRWSLVGQSDGPQTIEFRQARGTLDPNEIEMTVQFYVALVRRAEKLAAKYSNGRRAIAYWTRKFEGGAAGSASLQELLHDELALSQPAKAYWSRRWYEAAADTVRDPPLLRFERCVRCWDTHRDKFRPVPTDSYTLDLARGWREQREAWQYPHVPLGLGESKRQMLEGIDSGMEYEEVQDDDDDIWSYCPSSPGDRTPSSSTTESSSTPSLPPESWASREWDQQEPPSGGW